jgi:hypothetical protein
MFSTDDCTTCTRRGSIGRSGSNAPATQVVVTPSARMPSLAPTFSAVGTSANTPIDPVMVLASAITSSADIEIQ